MPGLVFETKRLRFTSLQKLETGIVSLVLEASAQDHARRGQVQALHLAVMNQDLDMVRLLLDNGAPID